MNWTPFRWIRAACWLALPLAGCAAAPPREAPLAPPARTAPSAIEAAEPGLVLEIRSRLETLARSEGVLNRGGPLPRDVPGVTRQVNALLAYPPEALAAALDRAIANEGELKNPIAGSLMEDLARILSVPSSAEETRRGGNSLTERDGFLLVDELRGGFYSGPGLPPRPRLKVAPGTRFRGPFHPRPFALLARLTDENAPGEDTSWGDRLLNTAGTELGDAAREDPAFASALLEASRRKEVSAGCATALTAALRRWGGPGALEELLRRLRSTLDESEDESMWRSRISALSRDVEDLGGGASLAALASEEGGLADEERRLDFVTAAGGDAIVGSLLEDLQSRPSVQVLRVLAYTLNDPYQPGEAADLRLRAFREADRIRRETGDPVVSDWSRALMQNALWPGYYGRFGFLRCPRPPGDFDRAGSLPDGRRLTGNNEELLGGYPDAPAQFRALEADIEAGRIRVDPLWRGCGNQYACRRTVEFVHGRGTEEDDAIAVDGRLEPGRVVLSVTNRGTEPIAVNPLAARYTSAAMLPLRGGRAGRVELQLTVGRVLMGYRLLVAPGEMKVVAPGETWEMAIATGPLPPGSRVEVTYMDDFEVDGPFDVPVLTELRSVVIE